MTNFTKQNFFVKKSFISLYLTAHYNFPNFLKVSCSLKLECIKKLTIVKLSEKLLSFTEMQIS